MIKETGGWICGIFLAQASVCTYLFICCLCRCALQFLHTFVSALSVVGGMLSRVVGSWFHCYKRNGEWRWVEGGRGLWLLPYEAVGGTANTLAEGGTLLAFRSNLSSLRGAVTWEWCADTNPNGNISLAVFTRTLVWREAYNFSTQAMYFTQKPCSRGNSLGRVKLSGPNMKGCPNLSHSWDPGKAMQGTQQGTVWDWWANETGQMKGRRKTGTTKMRFYWKHTKSP